MGIKKNLRPSAALKDQSKRPSFRNRSSFKPQTNKSRLINKKKAKMSLPAIRGKAPRFWPLFKLFDRGGMAYGRHSILRTARNDSQLRRKFFNVGTRSRQGVEDALLELLFQCRNLKDWDSGGDNLVDVFRLIKGRVKWAANCSVDLIMQLFFTLLRARLDCPAKLRKNSCKVALRVDKVISVSPPEHCTRLLEMMPSHSLVHLPAYWGRGSFKSKDTRMVRFDRAFMASSFINI